MIKKVMSTKHKRLFIIDGTALVYRAFHAIPATFQTSNGLHTNAVYGFTQSIAKILKDYSPEYIVVCFDVRGPTFRHLKFDGYKADRPPMPDILASQLPYIKDVLSAFKVRVLERASFEADDLIATIAHKAASDAGDVKTCIISGDKDLYQLVHDGPEAGGGGAVILDYLTGREYKTTDVVEKFGVLPCHIRDMLALAGDSSDNIPGVKGVGIKTAVKLIAQYGDIDGIYNNIDKISAVKLREKLLAQRDEAFFSRSLATLESNVDIDLKIDDLKYGGADYERLTSVMKELEFGRMLRSILREAGGEEKKQEKDPGDYAHIKDEKELREVCKTLKAAGRAAVALRKEAGHIEAVAIAVTPRRAWFIPLRDALGGELKGALKFFIEILEDKDVAKYTDDSKELFRYAISHGIDLRALKTDTTIASYLLNPSKPDHSVEALVFEFLGRMVTDEDEKNFNHIDLCKKSCNIMELSEKLDTSIAEMGLRELYLDMELPLSEVLGAMELEGMLTEVPKLREFSRELEIKLADIQNSIFTSAGMKFNIKSPKQLSEVLFKRLGLKPVKKTKTGFSTNEGVLKKLSAEHEVPALVLSYRELSKLKSTYVDGLLELINPRTGRVHTTFNQTVTATGRLSSSRPNMQNIPQRGSLAGRIREAFVAKEGFTLLSSDYSQIELRLVAHLSGDPALIEAFNCGEDVHSRTACELFGYASADEVPAEMRRRAKAINFGIIYGMGPYGLSLELGISMEEARDYIENYFAHYSLVKRFIDDTIDEAAKRGYTLTLFNRRRFVPELLSPIEQVRNAGRRIAINTPVQGSSADIIKAAMVRLHKGIKEAGFASRLILQIHDELLFETRLDELNTLSALVKTEMEGVVRLAVPVLVNLKHGRNWNEAMPLDI